MENIVTRSEKESIELLDSVSATEEELREFYIKLTESDDPEQFAVEVEQKLHSYKRASSNLMKAYTRSISYCDELAARWNDLTRGKKRKLIPASPANAVIDMAESRANHFASGLNVYKLLLICFIGSFFGVVVELIWCLLRNGYIESRSGLVYGPFNLLYGVGAVALTLALYRFRNKGKWISFFGGMIVGSAVEYVCSWWQETFLGSRSWDYSNMPFNLNGRICLLYAGFWGILGVLWVKVIYPWMAKLILRLTNRAGKIITWVLFAFFVINIVATFIAVFRWSQRLDNIAPLNSFWEFIDLRFPNERMEKIFANMKFS